MWATDSCTIRFFSSAPLEDIEAINDDAKSLINPLKSEIGVAVMIRGFRFKKALMQEHFNENYMESGKFPKATFKGQINEPVDFGKNSTIDMTATGTLEIHGIKKETTLKGKMEIVNGKIILNSKFKVKLAGYDIEIPSIVSKNIAEEVEVFFYAEYRMKVTGK
ncbi:MAG: YceI family protein [Bacteroidetes bacterium]|nr:YceI family protein [Bacteroidota bacterium]